MSGTILCGVTDSDEGGAAAQLARALATRLGLRLVLVHVVDGVPPGTEESLTARQRMSGGERTLETVSRELGTREETERRVVLGERAERLAQIGAEEGADLIVVGSRARGLRGRQLRCSLARELEAVTPVPVLIAPPQTRTRSARRLAVAEASAAR